MTLRIWHCDRGDVLLDGLVRMLGTLAVIALLCFEVVAVGVNMVQLDELAGEVARATARTLPARASAETLQALADQHARATLGDRPDVQLLGVRVDGDRQVSVSLERAPRTALVQHLPPLAQRLPDQVTGRGRPPTM